GFDIHVGRSNSDLFPLVLESSHEVAQALSREVLPVTTNIRDFTDAHVDWGIYHGAALASVALALQPMFRQMHIASTRAYDRLIPWGSHPLLDPLWSTESLALSHDGCEARRLEKVQLIAGSPIALSTLRVCWENPDNAYNCGRCEKCLRTMIALHI